MTRMKLDMDSINKIKNLNSVFMMNPFHSPSTDKLKEYIEGFNFFFPVYPFEVIDELLDIKNNTGAFVLPKCIFLPEK